MDPCLLDRSLHAEPPEIEEITDLARLERLAMPWDALTARSRGAHLFQSHSWICAWLRHVPLGRPRILIARRGELLTAAIPLIVEERGMGPLKLRTLRPTSPYADFADVLSDPDHPGDLPLLWSHLLGQHDWHALDLQYVRPGSLLSALATSTSAAFQRVRQPQGLAPYLDLTVDWKESVSSSQRSDWLRRRRRLAEQGALALSLAQTREEVEARVEEFADLHVARWAAKGGRSDYSAPGFRAFLREVCTGLLARGNLRLYRLSLDDRTVAIGLYFLFGRHLFPYSYAFAGEFSRSSPLHLLILHVVEDVQSKGLADVHDFGAGDEEYKLRWTKKAIPLERHVVAAPSLGGRASLWWEDALRPFLLEHPRLSALVRGPRPGRAPSTEPPDVAGAQAPA